MRKFFEGKDYLTLEMRNPINWKPVLTDNFQEIKKQRFLERKQAIDLYLTTIKTFHKF